MGQQRHNRRRAQQRRAEVARIRTKRHRLRDERREGARQAVADGQRRGCLFCRRTDGGFRSVEHIFPEGLGNQELLLPAGVVCDRCNHEVCAPLDAALCDFSPVAMMRTINGRTPLRAARLPRTTAARLQTQEAATEGRFEGLLRTPDRTDEG